MTIDQLIHEARAIAHNGEMTAEDAMRLTNAIRLALDNMPISAEQVAAQKAVIDASFQLLLLSKSAAATA